jgi:flagellar protein FliJ
MSRFSFRLMPLLQLREQTRDQLALEVGKAVEAIHRVETQILEIDNQLTQLRQHAAATLAEDRPSVDRMLAQGRFDMQLRADRHGLMETLTKLNEELTRRKRRLADAEAEVRQLERLRESQQLAHTEEQLRRNQIEMDERASARFMMARRESMEG